MAKAKPVKTPEVQSQSAGIPPSLNLALLSAIVAATASAAGFGYAPLADATPLAGAGFLEINQDPAANDPATGNVAVRATAAGIEYSHANPAPASAPAGFGTPAATSTPAATPAATEKVKPVYSVVSFDLPEAKRVGGSGGARPESYPFSKLEKGQAFFIPATAAIPNPEKKYASTVTSASNRYSKDDTAQPQFKNRKGNMAYPQIFERKFAIRRIEDGEAFGEQFKGVAGAAIGRII